MSKDFAVLKWVIFPVIAIGLAVAVSWFNVGVFGWEGSAMYLIVMGVLVAISLVFLRATSSDKRAVMIAAFIFHLMLDAALVVNLVYSLNAQRGLVMTKESVTERKEEMAEISKLRSRKAQTEAVKQLGARADVHDAFGKFERALFVITMAELGCGVIGLFVVFGCAMFAKGGRAARMPRDGFKGPRKVAEPSEPKRRPGFLSLMGSEGDLKPNEAGLKTSEGFMKSPEETSGNLRVIGQPSGVRVYAGNDYIAHVSWKKYRAGVADPERPTAAEIGGLLRG